MTASTSSPPPVGALVGREHDLAALHERWAVGARLVTLWGPAGIGKTRLASEYLRRQAPRGVFCDLSGVRSAAALHDALRTLSVDADLRLSERGTGSSRRDDRDFAVLDNLEQIPNAAEAIATLLDERPTLRCLVTSRERLRLRHEHVLEVRPLSLPEGPDDFGAESVQLLLTRARERHATLPLGNDDTRAVVELARRLEGVPLAIELAAARIELLGAHGLLDRSRRLLDLLATRDRDAVPRQSTLRAALQWSWDLLDDAEQRALCACGVFRGAFSVDAAEAAIAATADAPALDLVQSLRDKSLLHVGDGRVLWLLDGVRLFARERLDARSDDLRARILAGHAAHYLERARSAERRGETISDEVFDNLLAAAQHAADDAAPVETVADVLALLAQPARARGGSPALHDMLGWVLDRHHVLDGAREAKLRALSGALRHVAGEVEPALDELTRAAALAERVDDAALRAEIVTDLGVVHHTLRRLDQAADCYRKALELLPEGRPSSGRVRLVGNLGALHHDRREFDVAHAHYHDALELLVERPDVRLEGTIRGNLGVLEQEQGNLDAAETHYAKAVELLERADERRIGAITLGNLGSLHHERGALERACGLYRDTLERLDTIGDTRSQVLACVRLAAALAGLGDATGAERQLAHAEQHASRGADRIGDALIHLGRGFVEGAQALAARAAGEHEEADALIARARARIELHRHPVSRTEPIDVSDDLRWLMRLLTRYLTPHGLALEDLSEDALVVAADARFFRAPGHAWQDLRRHHVLRRMLQAFVERHATSPGRGLTLDGLQAAAWPSERIRPDALANRVYVAIAKLRKAGLKTHLLRDPNGYYLDPTLKVVRGEPVEEPE